MIRYYYLLIMVFLVTLGSSCASKTSHENNTAVQQPEITVINSEELEVLLEKEDLQLVDVRTPEEVSFGRIQGSVHIDIYDPEFTQKISQLDKDMPVVLYCAAGGRSAKASQQVLDMGFKKVIDYSPGYKGWVRDGKPIVKGVNE